MTIALETKYANSSITRLPSSASLGLLQLWGIRRVQEMDLLDRTVVYARLHYLCRRTALQSYLSLHFLQEASPYQALTVQSLWFSSETLAYRLHLYSTNSALVPPSKWSNLQQDKIVQMWPILAPIQVSLFTTSYWYVCIHSIAKCCWRCKQEPLYLIPTKAQMLTVFHSCTLVWLHEGNIGIESNDVNRAFAFKGLTYINLYSHNIMIHRASNAASSLEDRFLSVYLRRPWLADAAPLSKLSLPQTLSSSKSDSS